MHGHRGHLSRESVTAVSPSERRRSVTGGAGAERDAASVGEAARIRHGWTVAPRLARARCHRDAGHRDRE